jgi:hypothetical protein
VAAAALAFLLASAVALLAAIFSRCSAVSVESEGEEEVVGTEAKDEEVSFPKEEVIEDELAICRPLETPDAPVEDANEGALPRRKLSTLSICFFNSVCASLSAMKWGRAEQTYTLPKVQSLSTHFLHNFQT